MQNIKEKVLLNDTNKFKFHKTPFSPSFISSLTYNAENLMSSFEAAVVTSKATQITCTIMRNGCWIDSDEILCWKCLERILLWIWRPVSGRQRTGSIAFFEKLEKYCYHNKAKKRKSIWHDNNTVLPRGCSTTKSSKLSKLTQKLN